jgi:hypothetical protein
MGHFRLGWPKLGQRQKQTWKTPRMTKNGGGTTKTQECQQGMMKLQQTIART